MKKLKDYFNMKIGQGKTLKQYKDSLKFAVIGFVGVILVTVLVIIYSNTEFHKKVNEGIKNDPRPLSNIYNYSHPSTWHNDSVHEELMDKNGVEKGVMVDPISDDEYHRWISGDGDTIWE